MAASPRTSVLPEPLLEWPNAQVCRLAEGEQGGYAPAPMFTGLIQMVGTVREMRSTPSGARLVLEAPLGAVIEGESIALNGCCLTALQDDQDRFEADLSHETLDKTTFSEVTAGLRVNVERALTVGDALGGHLVQGHVDNTGTVRSVRAAGENLIVTFNIDRAFGALCVPKGSVTIDGVSLTVNELEDEGFSVNLVPHTLTHTTFDSLAAGKSVNLEADVIGKYVVRTLERLRGAGGVDQDLLARAGFSGGKI